VHTGEARVEWAAALEAFSSCAYILQLPRASEMGGIY
jgi:hypothetical protein